MAHPERDILKPAQDLSGSGHREASENERFICQVSGCHKLNMMADCEDHTSHRSSMDSVHVNLVNLLVALGCFSCYFMFTHVLYIFVQL